MRFAKRSVDCLKDVLDALQRDKVVKRPQGESIFIRRVPEDLRRIEWEKDITRDVFRRYAQELWTVLSG